MKKKDLIDEQKGDYDAAKKFVFSDDGKVINLK